ncbi:MAG: GNAT family N-acetyltransferase [Mesorhizobium sp.]|jgi:predicted GNAT family acetyltransferase
MGAKVQENRQLHRFELPISQGLVASAYYRVEDDRIVLFHTEVPSEFTGRGIGSRLAQGIFDLLRASGRKAVLKCPFMSRFFANHLDYLDVIAG